ncbi:hypothetical protein AciX9_2012 [Granulicella tundricola MP5ACTX9]|uniref:Uncharacterized protein n=1 Tax=Granulicella tundricola (strain ATCC BAA-1859 / DSM 23138 / MP5ACTX9) TaxID=1198114 RepID=E8X1A3_GRATM|nr:hypothetical protein AciX9_2012 [Granulicella tundricola MP5ACTX9]
MDERTIITAEAEAQDSERTETQQRDLQFLTQWKSIEEYPACPVGIGILRQMAEVSPGAYELAVARGFDRPDHPLLQRNPLWRAFVEHRNTCGECNEV